MRYALLAIGFSIALLWDAVANDSYYRLQVLKLLSQATGSLGF